jgi:outer membrane protein OmpA-like peptidoglycan-associated protein
MKHAQLSLYGIVAAVLLVGCTSSHTSSDQALESAHLAFQQLKDDADVLRSAPKDLIRAGESLAKADRLSSYWGSTDDVAHYAYLSQQYSAIAGQKSALNLNQERAVKLGLERQRLQLALREAKLLSLQDQNNWLEEQIASLATTQSERGLVMTLGDVLFDAGRSDLNVSANRSVLKMVQFLQLNPRRIVRIEGYTDSYGEAQENLQLSRDRAQAVADVLVDLGIESKRIEVQGHGESFPVTENASAKGRAQNRRVEIVFSDEHGQLGSSR